MKLNREDITKVQFIAGLLLALALLAFNLIIQTPSPAYMAKQNRICELLGHPTGISDSCIASGPRHAPADVFCYTNLLNDSERVCLPPGESP